MIYSNEETKRRILEHLKWDNRIDETKIQVRIDDETVYLDGTAPTWMSKQAAQNDAMEIAGVKKVINNIKILYPDNLNTVDDTELRESLRNVFSWDQGLSTDNIVITVENGTAVLEGAVDAYWKKTRAEELAFDIGGIVTVNNLLTVVPTKDILDEMIAQDIVNALNRNFSINAETIDVKAANGRVVLSGIVLDWNTYKKVFEIAKNTTGVKEVVNDLIISPSTL
ncbi:MAG TPA: BON domain-containing protein [Chitinispirillaceae bacterium]|nr:BON domain-containing protein [Chitinispirillaceae bacterium]